MIGAGLVRFQPDSTPTQDGGNVWKEIRQRAPAVIRDVVVVAAKSGLQGLNLDDKSGRINWRGALRGVKRGAKRAIKRKAKQGIKVLASKRLRRDIFGQ